jgi:chromosome segregation ATPase
LRFLLRLLFVLVVGALVGVGLYYGVPWVYRSLVVPVQENTVRLAALEQSLAQEQTRLQSENLAQQERIAALEAELTALREQSAVYAQEIEEGGTQIQQLDGRMTQAEEDLTAQQDTLKAARAELAGAIADLNERTGQTAGQATELEGRLALLQTAQDLLKVHLLLLEGNPRSARDTLALAATHLGQAATRMPEQAEALTALQERAAALDPLIAESNFRAGPELESLWADVMDLVLPPAGE